MSRSTHSDVVTDGIRIQAAAQFLPEESDEAMQLQVTLEEIQDAGDFAALCDRWRIYHGEPEDVRWARISIDAAKFDGRMFDGLALMQPNALAEAEPRICRKVNAEMRELLRKACLAVAEVEIEDPRLVGVDPLGFDVRGRFEIVRLDADPEIADEPDAYAALRRMTDIPFAIAKRAVESDGWRVEMCIWLANRLFSTTKMTGISWTRARLSDSCTTPSSTAPSPR